MKKISKGNKLRNKAEEILSEHITSDMPLSDEFFQLVHELQTYQIELEIQNEELKRSQEELEEARMKYFGLYEFAPVGYFSLDETEIIKEVNLAGATLLGIEKNNLVNTAFIQYIPFESRRTFYKHLKKVKATGTWQNCELELIKKDGTELYVHLETLPIQSDEKEFKEFRITATDITELISAEEALKESEARYHSLFENNHEVMLLIDPRNGEIVDANPAAASFYGYSIQQLVKLKITDINLLTDNEVFKEMLNAETGKTHHFLFKHRLANGKICDVDVCSGSIIINGETLLYSIIHDVTRQMKVENTLRESEERFRLIFDQSPLGDILVDLDYHPLRVNDALSNMLGYSKEELLSMKFPEYTHPEDLDAYLHQLRFLREGKIDNFEMEKRFIHKDGEIVWGHLNVSTVKNLLDKPVYFLARIEDITERKKLENAFAKKKEELQTIIDSSRTFIFYKDKYNHFLQVNQAFAEILSIPKEKLEGMSLFDIFPRKQAEAYWKDDKQVMTSGKPKVDIIEPMAFKNGVRYVKTDKIPYRDAHGYIIGIIGFADDITERQQADEELKSTMNELKRSNEELEQFAYVASHDLQEPLRMVSSFSQLLEHRYKNRLDEDADEFIEFIVDGAKRMKQLIDDLLAVSRVTRHAKEFESVQLETVLNTVVSNLSILIEETEAVITHDPLPPVFADPSQLMRVFQNLISNAIKFQDQNTPKIHISAQKSGKEWRFAVADNGIGINPEHQKQIFDVFKRLNREEYKGTGIGLFICQKIIQRHGGRIWVESELGEGSTFYFTITDK